MLKKKFGDAGNRILVEEREYGIEVAFQVITDGENVLPFGAVRDYKKAYEELDIPQEALKQMFLANEMLIGKIMRDEQGKVIHEDSYKKMCDEGKLLNPNTGGMGAVFPHPYVNREVEKIIMDQVAIPLVKKFREKTGLRFKGILYPVIMLCKEDEKIIPKVLEINVRECDPGVQAKYPMLLSDFYELCKAVTEKKLHQYKFLEWREGYSIAACTVSGMLWGGPKDKKRVYPGYPGDHLTNQVIKGLEDILAKDCRVYANGIVKGVRGFETSGGRVTTVQADGKTIQETRERVYSYVKNIQYSGVRYRTDIGLDFVSD